VTLCEGERAGLLVCVAVPEDVAKTDVLEERLGASEVVGLCVGANVNDAKGDEATLREAVALKMQVSVIMVDPLSVGEGATDDVRDSESAKLAAGDEETPIEGDVLRLGECEAATLGVVGALSECDPVKEDEKLGDCVRVEVDACEGVGAVLAVDASEGLGDCETLGLNDADAAKLGVTEVLTERVVNDVVEALKVVVVTTDCVGEGEGATLAVDDDERLAEGDVEGDVEQTRTEA